MEVSVDLVGAPPAEEADAVAVDPRTHEDHGAAGASQPSRDVRGINAKIRGEPDGDPYEGCDSGRLEIAPHDGRRRRTRGI